MSAQNIALLRGLLLLIAVLFETNTIPTGVEGGGRKVAATLSVIAVSLAAGQKNDEPVK